MLRSETALYEIVPQSLFPQTEHCRILPTCIVA